MKNKNMIFNQNGTIEFERELVYFPRVQEVFEEIGKDKLDIYNLPFLVSLDYFEIKEEYKDRVKTFDLLFQRNPDGKYLLRLEDKENDIEKPYLYILIESLVIYFRTSNIKLVEEEEFIHINNIKLNRDNFDELKDLILKINNITLKPPEKVPEFKNDKQREVYTKIMEGRRRKEEKNQITFDMIVGYVQFGGKSFIPFEVIGSMTLPQLYYSYKNISLDENYNKEYQKYLVGVDPKNLDLTHWMLKVNK